MVQPGIPGGIKWADYAERWIGGSAWKPETKRVYRTVLRQFCQEFTDLPTSPGEIQEWASGLRRVKGVGRRGPLPSMDHSSKTKYYKIIREFYSWLKYEHAYGATDPKYRPGWRALIPDLPYKSFGPNKWSNLEGEQ